ncbi:MAG: outer membrane protein [Parachlamydiaceae bacterium]
MNRTTYFCIIILMLLSSMSFAEETCEKIKNKGHRFWIGPEVYHVHRNRENGAKQNGWLGGGRFLYDHMRRYTFYWAVEGAYAQGELKGRSGNRARIKSKMIDRSIETRLGYTFQCKYDHQFAVTPFFGVGYLIEQNNFKHPSSLHLHFKTSYRYFTVGFISSIRPCNNLTIGLNVKLRHLIDPECKITRDPEFDSVHLKIDNDALQYRIELPIIYAYCSLPYGCKSLSIVAIPFYESRYYGRNAGYPFDFLRTRLFDSGLTVQALVAF